MREGGTENEAVKKRGFDIFTFPAVGLKRDIGDIFKFIKITIGSIIKCFRKIKEYKPDRIFATGGYVSFAPAFCGRLLKIPTFIHESNSSPGTVTKILAKLGCGVLLNMEETKKHFSKNKKATVVGNPLLPDFNISKASARQRLGISESDVLVISFGGSGGSQVMNDIIIRVMQKYCRKSHKIRHIHATGKKYFEVAKRYSPELTSGINGCKIVPYIDDMPLKLRAADIVIARCGAITLSEIAVCKVASILIPSPNVTDNHQYKNGVFLERQKAVIMIEEKDLTEEKLISELTKLEASKDLRNRLGEKIFKTVKTDAADRTSDILME